MSEWTDIEDEIAGVRTAARNLHGDPKDLASYVYRRTCKYIGPRFDDVAKAMIEEALRAAPEHREEAPHDRP